MIWQDLVFLLGSSLSIVFLAPTLRDASARVPLGTSLPSMSVGAVYAVTFGSMGMSFSALGALATASMWSLIALYRSPTGETFTLSRRERFQLFGTDVQRWVRRRTTGLERLEQYVLDEDGSGAAVVVPGGRPTHAQEAVQAAD